ncbi:hypothetical protein J7L48_00785 [bacterium]|nr:hypothetical protein [bacterium]
MIDQKWKKIEHIIHQIFVRDIYPKWINEKMNFQTFKEWEEHCLNFTSAKYISNAYINIILSVFGSIKNLNYYFFWKLNE